jgi:hypothetical protein
MMFMRCLLLFGPLALLALMATACTEREPPNEGQVTAMAGALVEQYDLVWGPPTAVWPPSSPDADGRRWWQVDYRDHRALRDPVVLVDAQTGWARFAQAGEQIRFGISPLRNRHIDRPAAPPASGDAGSWILVVSEHDEDLDIEAEARRLNQIAGRSSLRPLFSVRITRRGDRQVVYGWDGTQGINRDDLVTQFLLRWGEPAPIGWEDLARVP